MVRWLVCLLIATPLSAAEVSVLDYGAVANDGQDDTAAFRAAVQAGGVVRVPAGVYSLSISGRYALDCGKSVQLIGEGRDLTVLRCEDKLAADGCAVFFRPGTRGVLADLSIVGPTDTAGFACNVVLHYGGIGGSLKIDGCTISGGIVAVKVEEQQGRQDQPRLLVMDSAFDSPQPVMMLNSGYCDLLRTEFRGYGTAGSNKDHAIYVYPPVHLLVDRCVFAGNRGEGYDLHPWSSTVTGKGSVTVRDSEFRPSPTGRGILTHPEGLTLIRGCRLGGTPIRVSKGGTVIAECTLAGKGQVTPWPYSPPGPGGWAFRDCRFGE